MKREKGGGGGGREGDKDNMRAREIEGSERERKAHREIERDKVREMEREKARHREVERERGRRRIDTTIKEDSIAERKLTICNRKET